MRFVHGSRRRWLSLTGAVAVLTSLVLPIPLAEAAVAQSSVWVSERDTDAVNLGWTDIGGPYEVYQDGIWLSAPSAPELWVDGVSSHGEYRFSVFSRAGGGKALVGEVTVSSLVTGALTDDERSVWVTHRWANEIDVAWNDVGTSYELWVDDQFGWFTDQNRTTADRLPSGRRYTLTVYAWIDNVKVKLDSVQVDGMSSRLGESSPSGPPAGPPNDDPSPVPAAPPSVPVAPSNVPAATTTVPVAPPSVPVGPPSVGVAVRPSGDGSSSVDRGPNPVRGNFRCEGNGPRYYSNGFNAYRLRGSRSMFARAAKSLRSWDLARPTGTDAAGLLLSMNGACRPLGRFASGPDDDASFSTSGWSM